jgi:hypothetical protein
MHGLELDRASSTSTTITIATTVATRATATTAVNGTTATGVMRLPTGRRPRERRGA